MQAPTRYEFTRKQKREMWERCKDGAGIARCEALRPAIVTAMVGARLGEQPPSEMVDDTLRLARCNAPLKKGRFTYDHTDPTYIAAKRVTAADGQVICRACDREKYSSVDRPKIDKVRRLADAEIGARRPRRSIIPGSKGSGYRRRFNKARGRWETQRVQE